MFSGIIEAVVPTLQAKKAAGLVRIHVQKPIEFQDIKPGDSIAANGVCLTLESFDENEMVFALAAETLQVLGLNSPNAESLLQVRWNLERSLRFGDRIHGHLVTGHVDSLGRVQEVRLEGESLFLKIAVADSIKPFVWRKGSITVNGTSLTVNELERNVISVCLIPETQKRTNLGALKNGDSVTIEADYFAKAMTQVMAQRMESRTEMGATDVR